MEYNEDFATAVELTAEARAAAIVAATQYRLDRYLPRRENYSLSFNFDVGQVGLTDAASFRSWDTTAELGRTDGTVTRSGKLPPISRKYHIGEFEQLSLFNQGEAIKAKQLEYARRLGRSIAARFALAQGEAIEKGVVTLNENGLQFVIDYGRKAEHTIVAGVSWSSGSAVPLDNLDSAAAVYRLANGGNPGVLLTSTRVLTALSKSTEIIKQVVGRGSDLISRVSFADVRSVLADYGYGRVEIFDETIDGVRLIADDKVIFLPDDSTANIDGGPLGTTEVGVTAESIKAKYGIAEQERPGIFSASFNSSDPEGEWVLGSAVGIPAVTNANASLVLDVL